MKTQNQRLLERLQVRSVTPLEAWEQLGIYRLSSRVHELRSQGHAIESKMVEVLNQFNEPVRVAKYTLV